MKQECVVKANSIEAAKDMAAEKLGKNKEELEFVVRKDVKKGLFGKIKEQAEVYAFYEEEVEEKTESASVDNGKEINLSEFNEKMETGTKYLQKVLENIGCKDFKLEGRIDRKVIVIKVISDDMNFIIGRRGENIYAIQYLTTLAANNGSDNYVRIIIECGDYRERRATRLKKIAENVAKECIRDNKYVCLEPMNSYERRIIHTEIGNIDGVYSKSIGEEPKRKIAIASNSVPEDSIKDIKKSFKKKKNYHNNNKGGKRRNYQTETYSQPSTYNFEKEFLKKDTGNNKLYGKIDVD